MRMLVKGEILEIQDDYAVRMMEQGQAVPAPYAPEPKERIATSAPEEPPRNDNDGAEKPAEETPEAPKAKPRGKRKG